MAMMALLIERVRMADKKTVELINVYIKHIQALLLTTDNINSVIIPELVIYWIIAFYYNPEYFTTHGQHIKLNEAQNIATYCLDTSVEDSPLNTVYGNIRVTNNDHYNKFVWEFRISKAAPNIVIAIGLDSSDKLYGDKAFDSYITRDNVFYSFEDNSSLPHINKSTANDKGGYDIDAKEYGTPFTLGQENNVIMEFDTKKKTLRYFVNGEDQGIAVDKDLMQIDENEFIAAISMNDAVIVELLRFQQKMNKTID